MFILLFFVEALFIHKTHKRDTKSVTATFEQAKNNYILQSYLNAHSIPLSLYQLTSNGDASNYPVSNIYTESTSYWVSGQPCTDSFRPTLTYTFDKTVSIEAFLLYSAYRTRDTVRYFDGFPEILNIYATTDNRPDELKVVFSGTAPTSTSWGTTQFVFPEPIECTKLVLEYVKATPCDSFNMQNATVAAAQKIILVGDVVVHHLAPNGESNQYSDSAYINPRKISPSEFQYSSNAEAKSGYPLRQAFDGNNGNYFVSNVENNDTFKTSITIDFNEVREIEGFLMATAYRTRYPDTGTVRYFDGFPTTLNVYTSKSTTDDSLVLDTVFEGNPVNPWTIIQFIFNRKVECRKLKLEYATVTADESFSNGLHCAVAAEITFLKYIEVPPPTATPVATPLPTPTQSPLPAYLNMVIEKASGDYANADYVSKNKIATSLFEVTTNGDKSGNPISNALDDTKTTFWVSSQPNSDSFKATITFSFTKTVLLDAFLLNPAYRTRDTIRHFDGYPLKASFYASTENGPYELLAAFSGEKPTSTSWDLTQFVFMYPIRCDSLKIEFDNITENDSFNLANATQLALNEIKLIGKIAPNYLAPAATAGSFNTPQYVASHRIPLTEFTATANGNAKSNYPLLNAFDRNEKTYWAQETENSDTFHSTITLEFKEVKTIEAILWDTAYRTRYPSTGTVRYFDGFPTKMNVFISTTTNTEEEFYLNSVFEGEPVFPWMRVQFVFKEPIQCRVLKLELVNVTADESFSSGKHCATAGEIYVISSNEQLPDPTSSPKPTSTPTQSAVATPKASETPTPMATETPTASISMTPEPTATPMATPTATPMATPTASPSPNPMDMTFEKANGVYADANYVNQHKIANSFFEASTNGDKSGYPISNALDGVGTTFWVSEQPNSDSFKATITFNFTKTVLLQAFLINPAYRTRTTIRYFDGLPIKVNFYISNDDSPFEIVSSFSGEIPTDITWDLTQFAFALPIQCDKLRVEFVNVSPNDSFELGGATQASLNEIKFIGDVLPDHVESIGLEGLYENEDYTVAHTISTDEFTYSSNGDKSGNPIANAFDDLNSTYWVSGTENSDAFKASITIEFNEIKTIDAFIIFPAYRTRDTVRYFDGFPTTLNVYSSLTTADNSLLLDTIFEGNPHIPWTKIQFVFKKPIRCRKLKLEFYDVTLDESFWKTKYCAVVGGITILQEAEKPPALLPDQDGTIEIQPDQCNQKYRCDQNITENKYVVLDVKETNFTNYQNEDDGGAISLINCGFDCAQATFDKCTSNKAGGAIFFLNLLQQQSDLNLENNNFVNCSAVFGGAAYVCSSWAYIKIHFCDFQRMSLLPPGPNAGEFYGGSALFLTFSNGDVKDNKFKFCAGAAVKVHPNYYKYFVLSSNVVNIANCTFESDERSTAAIYFVRGSNSHTTFNLIECVFTGKLNHGCYFIDGKSISNKSPKLLVSKCKFASSSAEAFDLRNYEEYMSIDLKDQQFSENSISEVKNADSLANLKITFLVVAPVALVAIVTLIVVLVIRKRKNTNNFDEVEMSVETSQDLQYQSNNLDSLNQSLI